MPYQPPEGRPDISRARTYLAQSPIQTKDQALFQSINLLIQWLQSLDLDQAQSSLRSIGDFAALEYLTASDETAELPNSRELLAGTGVSFDDTTPGERTVNATGSGGTITGGGTPGVITQWSATTVIGDVDAAGITAALDLLGP